MAKVTLYVTGELKDFITNEGEKREYVDLRADVGGISVKLYGADSTAKELIKNYVQKGGEN